MARTAPLTLGPVVAPLVHLNGTGRAGLIEGLRAAEGPLRQALAALERGAAPNQRDYYPLPEGVWQTARDAHVARVQAVAAVLKQIERVHEAVSDSEAGILVEP